MRVPRAQRRLRHDAEAISFLIDMMSSLAQYVQVWMSGSAKSIRSRCDRLRSLHIEVKSDVSARNIPNGSGLIGTGSVGCGWAAIYIARGYEVDRKRSCRRCRERARAFIADTWDALRKLGVATSSVSQRQTCRSCATPAQSPPRIDLVHENAPENLAPQAIRL